MYFQNREISQMRVVLRDFRTGLYVGRERNWTGNPETARTFSNRFRANAYKVCHCLPEAKLVAVPASVKSIPVFPPEDPSGRARSPLRAGVGCGDEQRTARPTSAAEFMVELRTMVWAKIELGAGNALFIRGEGEGLDWQRGQAMAQLDEMTWIWSAHPAKEPVVFQLLLNDLILARGDKVTLEPGGIIGLVPDFEWPEMPRVSLS